MIQIRGPNKIIVRSKVRDRKDGHYDVMFEPSVPGFYQISLSSDK